MLVQSPHLDLIRSFISDFSALKTIEKILKEHYGINHVNIQPEYNKEDPKDFIVQDSEDGN